MISLIGIILVRNKQMYCDETKGVEFERLTFNDYKRCCRRNVSLLEGILQLKVIFKNFEVTFSLFFLISHTEALS